MDKSNLRAAAQAVFTPGPWEAAKDPVPTEPARWAVYANGAPRGHRLPAECVGPDAQANAKLIAAAPELYEALRALIDGFDHVANCRECGEMSPESCGADGGGWALEARAKAVAVMAKAEGRSAPTAPPETP